MYQVRLLIFKGIEVIDVFSKNERIGILTEDLSSDIYKDFKKIFPIVKTSTNIFATIWETRSGKKWILEDDILFQTDNRDALLSRLGRLRVSNSYLLPINAHIKKLKNLTKVLPFGLR